MKIHITFKKNLSFYKHILFELRYFKPYLLVVLSHRMATEILGSNPIRFFSTEVFGRMGLCQQTSYDFRVKKNIRCATAEIEPQSMRKGYGNIKHYKN